MKTKLNEAFPIVAAALGNRLGVRVLVTGQTARTNGEMIVIPAYDGEDPKYRDVAWGYLAHEAAHIRYTDFGVFKSACTTPFRKAILNIIEDIRIEKRLAVSYPGTRYTIEKTVAQLIDDGGYEIPSEGAHPAVILQAALLFGLRCSVLGQTRLKGMAEAAEECLKEILPSRVFDDLAKLQEEVEGLKDTQDTLLLTDRILKLLELNLKKENQEDESHQKRKDEEDQGHSISESSESQSSELGTPEDEDDEGADDSSYEELSVNQASSLGQILGASESDLQGDLFETIRESLVLEQGQASALTLPVADEPPMDTVKGRLLLEKALRESGKLRASLQGLIQACRLSKPITRRSGNRMDSKRLSRLMGDSRVFLRMDAHKAPNKAVHILVDRSPSMSAIVATEGRPVGRRIDMAWEATLALAMALEGIQGVSVGITAFPGKDGEGVSVYEVLPHGTSIRSRIGAFGGHMDGSTPLAEALWYARAQLVQQREERKLLLVLTDGIPDDLDAALHILSRCRFSNIEVTGIGLGIEVDRVFESSVSGRDISCLMPPGQIRASGTTAHGSCLWS